MDNSVQMLSELKPIRFEDEWFDEGSESNFWMAARFQALQQVLEQLGPGHITRQPRVLDVGGGRGVLRRQLENGLGWAVDMCDLDIKALEASGNSRGRTLYYDVTEESRDMVENFDLIFLFDVLEHITDPVNFLSSVARHLSPGGVILLNVPAIPSMISAYDEAVGHHRRYNTGSLNAELIDAGLQAVLHRYWGISLIPALAARRMMLGRHLDAKNKDRIIALGWKPAHPIIEWVLRTTVSTELKWLRSPPIGTSLMCAIKKPAGSQEQ